LKDERKVALAPINAHRKPSTGKFPISGARRFKQKGLQREAKKSYRPRDRGYLRRLLRKTGRDAVRRPIGKRRRGDGQGKQNGGGGGSAAPVEKGCGGGYTRVWSWQERLIRNLNQRE